MSVIDDGYDVWDRRARCAVRVPIFDARRLHFCYRTPLGRLLMRSLLSLPTANTVYAWSRYRPSSAQDIPGFVARYDIPVDELAAPLGSYRTFNDFFIRRLRPGSRPVDADPAAVVAPSDGQLLVFPDVGDDTTFAIKGASFTLRRLLGDDDLVAALRGGSLASIYLAPFDYHRFHYPLGATLERRARRGHRLLAVNPEVSIKNGFRPFDVNVREVNVLVGDGVGTFVQVEVGAFAVGRIVSTDAAPGRHEKGAEKGYFGFGGSSVLLAFKRGAVTFDDDVVEASARGLASRVRMGERIAVTASR